MASHGTSWYHMGTSTHSRPRPLRTEQTKEAHGADGRGGALRAALGGALGGGT